MDSCRIIRLETYLEENSRSHCKAWKRKTRHDLLFHSKRVLENSKDVGRDVVKLSFYTTYVDGAGVRVTVDQPRTQMCVSTSSLRVQADKQIATAAAGVGFHHGGLSVTDRRTVEQAFLSGQINIICSTSTLAVGVNLPCYLVILKGTCAWSDNGLKEYADLEVMQMLGRAGRPQFETSACAVILTRKDKVSRYEKMVSGEELLESCLHQNLIEHLNAEIVLGTVHDVATATQWLTSTFLYVRLQKNPSHYHFREGIKECADDKLLEQLCQKDIDLLLGAGIVHKDARLLPTLFGEAMARYYVTFETMQAFIGLPSRAKMSEIVRSTPIMS